MLVTDVRRADRAALSIFLPPSGPVPMTSHPNPLRPVVLLVEDEPLVRMDAADVLENAGFEVIEAADAGAAREALERRPDIHVLFTDVQMPGPMNGLELAWLLHKHRPGVCLL